jgi:hypothetical protein
VSTQNPTLTRAAPTIAVTVHRTESRAKCLKTMTLVRKHTTHHRIVHAIEGWWGGPPVP